MSISSSDGLSGSRSKSSFLKIIWQVEQDKVPSQAPKCKKKIIKKNIFCYQEDVKFGTGIETQ